ncbi:hypothetical protein MG293_001715 [Ovis ammon polii]|uniref:Uncharacterized protein n=1 Tax=Ovis ammon polii TaxID=230172 RepID=A0AAD4YFW6_OVIAM|nr:hypothetical protein MG293_001715 [Ovis ammon polii]
MPKLQIPATVSSRRPASLSKERLILICFVLFLKFAHVEHLDVVASNQNAYYRFLCAQLLQSCVILYNTVDCSPSKNSGEDYHFLLQVIFLNQGLNLHLLHWTLYSLSVPGKEERAELHAVLRTEIMRKGTCLDPLQLLPSVTFYLKWIHNVFTYIDAAMCTSECDHRFSRVRLLATPWTAAYQAPPSMEFSRQEYWSGVPLPSPSQRNILPSFLADGGGNGVDGGGR